MNLPSQTNFLEVLENDISILVSRYIDKEEYPIKYNELKAQFKDLLLSKKDIKEHYDSGRPITLQFYNAVIGSEIQAGGNFLLGNKTRTKKHYIGIKPSTTKDILYRSDLVGRITKAMEKHSIINLYGASANGKSIIAETIFNREILYFNNLLWLDCKNNLIETFASEYKGDFDTRMYEELPVETLYKMSKAYIKNELVNRKGKKLVVLDNITDFDGQVRKFMNLLDIPDTHVIITSHHKVDESEIFNIEIPALSTAERKTLIELLLYGQDIPDAVRNEVQKLPSLALSIFASNLPLKLKLKGGTDHHRALKDFCKEIMVVEDGKSIEEEIYTNLYLNLELSVYERWILLFFSLLPPIYFSPAQISDYLGLDSVSESISHLKGLDNYLKDWFEDEELESTSLTEIIENLFNKKWLIKNSESKSYKIHDKIAECIIQSDEPRISYYEAYANNLNEGFFTLAHIAFDELNYTEYSQEEIDGSIALYSIMGELDLYLFISSFLDRIVFDTSEKYRDLLSKAAILCEQKVQYKKQATYLRLLLKAKKLVYDISDFEILTTWTDLGLVLQDLGDYEGAKALLEKAVISAEKNLGTGHPATAAGYSNLAMVLQDLGDYEGAKALLEKAVISDEKNLGTGHPTTAVRYSNLALVLQDLGDYEGAKALLEKAVISAEKNLGTGHPTTAVRYSNLALVLKDLGDYEGAKALLEKAVVSDEKNLGTGHPRTAGSYSNLAMVLQDLGDYEGAKALLEKAVISDEKNLGTRHPTTAIRYSNLALVLKDLGDYEGAKALLEKAVVSVEKNLGTGHPKTAGSYSNLAMVLHDLGDYEGAKALLEKAVVSVEKNLGTGHPTTAGSYSNLATVLQDLGDYEGAKVLSEKAVVSAEKNLGTGHPTTAGSYSNLAMVLKDLGDYEGAKALLEKAVISMEKNLGTRHPRIARCHSRLGMIHKDIGNYGEAKELMEKALTIYKEKLGLKHPKTKKVSFHLISIYKELGEEEKREVLSQRISDDI